MRRDKRRRAEAREGKARAERRSQIAAILEALGLRDDFNRSLPQQLRDRILDLRAPRPVISLAEGLPSNPQSLRHLRALDRVLKRATFPCPPLGQSFPVVDYFTRVKPLADCIAGAAGPPRAGRASAFLERGRAVAERLRSLDTGAMAVAAALRATGFAMLPEDRIDCRVHSVDVRGGRTEQGRWFLRLVLDAHAPERINVAIDGVERPATRVPCSRPDGLAWVDWDPAVLGLRQGRLPVFVQGHALRSVTARLCPRAGGEWLMHQHMCHSLAEPVVARRDGPDVLVEFRLNTARVGYLACRLVGARVVVRTFLFLTMDGTPEGDALRRGLRLARDDKRYLGLDALHTYLTTDLAGDARLAELFAGFGCGDLFELGRLAASATPHARLEPGLARLVCKHLGFDDDRAAAPVSTSHPHLACWV